MKGKNKLPYNRWQIFSVMETKRIFFLNTIMVCPKWYRKLSPLGIYLSNCICCFCILAPLCFLIHISSSFRYLCVFNHKTFHPHVVFLADYVCGLVPGGVASPLCPSVTRLLETFEPRSQDVSQIAERSRCLMKTEAG